MKSGTIATSIRDPVVSNFMGKITEGRGGGRTNDPRIVDSVTKPEEFFPPYLLWQKARGTFLVSFLLQKRRFTTNILLQEIQIWRQKLRNETAWLFGGMESA